MDMSQGDLNNANRKKALSQNRASSLEVVGSRNGRARAVSPIRVSAYIFAAETIKFQMRFMESRANYEIA